MPYVKQDQRDRIFRKMGWDIGEPDYDHLDLEEINCAGDMQYAIAIIIKDYLRKKGLHYQSCNDIMGALTGAQQEFYRRVVAPYEEEKIKENGDV